MDKKQLRRDLQKHLIELSDDLRCEKSRQISKNLISMPQFQNAATIMIYLTMPHEVDTSEIILHAWQMGKSVAVPKISWQQRHMIAVKIHSLDNDFATEVSGLRNPTNGTPVAFEEIDMVITPGLGFDRKGNRLGRGGSYYDRFFANEKLKAHRCAICFSQQIVDAIPVAEHDERVDSLVTEKEIIYTAKTDRIRTYK